MCSHPQVCRFLGAGGYGEVYLCKWASVDVAVKCLNPGLIMGAGAAMTVGEDGFSSSSSDAVRAAHGRRCSWGQGRLLQGCE